MAKGLIEQSTLTAIADAIRAKSETSDTMLPSEMAGLIDAISTGVEMPDWISEIEFAQVTLSEDSDTLQFPCSMSDAPTMHVLWPASPIATGSVSTSTRVAEMNVTVDVPVQSSSGIMYNSKTISAVFGVSYSTLSSVSPGTWTVSDGVASLYSGDTYLYRTKYTYNVIMWR